MKLTEKQLQDIIYKTICEVMSTKLLDYVEPIATAIYKAQEEINR